ncbi:hypothetical protein NMG60_11019559 [Bertholletia excelsa]
MDSFTIGNIQIEKTNAILRYRRLRKIANLFRIAEFFFLLVMLSRFFPQISATFKLSGDYFRRLLVTVPSPQFVFVIGNTIVIVLYLKSGRLTSHESAETKTCTDIYEELVQITEKNRNNHVIGSRYEMKQDTVVTDISRNNNKKIRRSSSEKLSRDGVEKPRRELRRSVTEIRQRSTPMTTSSAEDEMTSDEFRRTVEAFIARQQKLLRDEEFSAIVSP